MEAFASRPAEVARVRTAPELEPQLAHLVALYKRVFSESSWQEGWKCGVCGRKGSFSRPPESGACCGVPPADFHADGTVAAAMRGALAERDPHFLVLRAEGRPAGFAFGYAAEPGALNRATLGIPDGAWEGCLRAVARVRGRVPELVRYVSEVGVDPDLRGCGLGERLVRAADACAASDDPGGLALFRTSARSAMYGLGRKLGYVPMYDYADADARVLCCKPL